MEIIDGILKSVTNEDIVDGKFVVPEGVTSIGGFAFIDCHSLTSIDIPNSVISIRMYAFKYCNNLEKLITPWGEIELENIEDKTKSIIQNYLYLYANHLLKEKYRNLEDFLSNPDIRKFFEVNILYSRNPIQKFKTLFYKTRKSYDIPPKLLSFLKLETIEEFNLESWNRIKNTFEWGDSEEMSKAFAEMIEVFGLFHKDSTQEERTETFQGLFQKPLYRLNTNQYKSIRDSNIGHLTIREFLQNTEFYTRPNVVKETVSSFFQKKNNLYFRLKKGVQIPTELQVYLRDKLTEEELKRIKKINGTYGNILNRFIKNNYVKSYIEEYELLEGAYSNQGIMNRLFHANFLGYFNYSSLHRMFNGCNELYDEKFYEFFIENLPFILTDEKLQSDVKNIQKHFKSMKSHYLSYSGIEHITLKQAIDYINNVVFAYHKGNYELMRDVKKAGVVNQESFNYYQEVYEKNDIRRLYSLVRRSNIYEVNGYTIKAELLRKDDSFSMLVGEKNYTNCCQIFGGIGHNCMAHAVNSSDGGIFVTRLLKDGNWILLTESWDWQNNNLYCHDNIEGTPYFNYGPQKLKEAVAEVIRLDGEYIIEKSKKEVEKYIESRKKSLEKTLSQNKEEELEELRELEEREVIKLVTCGTGSDDLGVSKYFKSSISVNGDQMIGNKRFTLSNFQPVNYNSTQVYFDRNHGAYSDAKDTQVMIAGSIEELCLEKLEPLVPIYRDERRLVLEEKEEIRDYTIKKIGDIENRAYPEAMKSYQNSTKEDFSDSQIYLGEDWYLIYEEREDNSIYISDLARVESILTDEKSRQNEEMLEIIYHLVRTYDYVEADLKEDTSYLLYLMNKKLGYLEQIGEDIRYPFGNDSNTRVVTEEEQDSMLKRIQEIREKKNLELMMHKIRFKRGRLLGGNMEHKVR